MFLNISPSCCCFLAAVVLKSKPGSRKVTDLAFKRFLGDVCNGVHSFFTLISSNTTPKRRGFGSSFRCRGSQQVRAVFGASSSSFEFPDLPWITSLVLRSAFLRETCAENIQSTLSNSPLLCSLQWKGLLMSALVLDNTLVDLKGFGPTDDSWLSLRSSLGAALVGVVAAGECVPSWFYPFFSLIGDRMDRLHGGGSTCTSGLWSIMTILNNSFLRPGLVLLHSPKRFMAAQITSKSHENLVH